MTILVTGGAGYIGSHTLVELLSSGQQVLVLDNLSNASKESLSRVAEITGKQPEFVKGDIRDAALLDTLFSEHNIDAVVHFAGLKAVGESVEQPLRYYDNNVNGTLVLVNAMQKAGVFKLVFSSSATVYGSDALVPYHESMSRGQTANPYGTSKAMTEQILTDLAAADSHWSIALLRYFNPVGAHESGLIGEDPFGVPNNLMPFITQVAVGRRDKLFVFGNDYPTADGSCERDYLHVVDLAIGHVKALDYLSANTGVHAFNLGTGSALSVLAMINSFELASGKSIPFEFAPRRIGDLPAFWADPAKALTELGWRAERGLEQIMSDAWRWQSQNPDGYGK
ncbi:UDP-glucose 4-epimerase [Oceanisphaera marina]|uniref:UDP-glucose 4-epimerase n=1 Tax=Oceanisphaera marina TaxID=2017550 RepID=A0ABQ1IYZ3_9GAMM|nr:UDP-glucose 4-epimerase GalE [Oceanisphaera marina]GGB53186.1 UDP-glucose 4-epimerase [Oceanisphaera marina]